MFVFFLYFIQKLYKFLQGFDFDKLNPAAIHPGNTQHSEPVIDFCDQDFQMLKPTTNSPLHSQSNFYKMDFHSDLPFFILIPNICIPSIAFQQHSHYQPTFKL